MHSAKVATSRFYLLIKSMAIVTVCTLVLTGCDDNLKGSTIDQSDLQKQQIILKRNQAKWDKNAKQIDKIVILSSKKIKINSKQSLSNIKKSSDFFVQGTVIDFSNSNLQTTRTSIYVNHIISGSEEILGKNIEVELPGGINQNIYYKSLQCPLPNLGQKVILRLDEHHNNFQILAPYSNFWIEKDHEFVLNNSEIQQKSSLKEITEQLNQAIPYRYTDLC